MESGTLRRKAPWAALAAALLLSAWAPSAGADKATEALKLIDQGIELFKRGSREDLEAARLAFTKAHDMFPEKANPYRWLGLAEARLGRCAEAVKNLDEFLRRVKTEDARTIEAVTVRDRCREDLVVKVGTLVVDSTPSGAEVYLDTESSAVLGTTPFRSDKILVGAHVVFLKKAGYQTASKAFTVGRNDTVRLDTALQLERPPEVARPGGGAPLAIGETAPPPQVKKKPLWVIGLVGAVVAVTGVSVGLGIGLTQGGTTETAFPAVSAR